MKKLLIGLIVVCFLVLSGNQDSSARKAYDDAFDFSKVSDMSDFDPNNPVMPSGDTIKIAIIASFSGPAATVGEIYWLTSYWVAYDINKRGGIMVDGKKKKIQLFRADTRSKPAEAKKVTERMVLQEKVDILWGTNGSHIMKIINQVAKKYKVIAMNGASLSDELYDRKNFTRYSFMTTVATSQVGGGLAYYYGKIRKKEKKFYILGQDYLFGHSLANAFKRGLKKFYPRAKIVGEDFHKLFAKDFAPYLTKIKASGAEVIFTGDWIPDAANLLKQTRAMGIKLPIANLFINDPNFLATVGVEGSKNLVHFEWFGSHGKAFKNKAQIKYVKMWKNLWENKWGKPYNSPRYKWAAGTQGSYMSHMYWLMAVLKRAGSTDPEKIIKTWEGHRFKDANGTILKMRAFDHKTIQDTFVEIYLPPDQQKGFMNIPPYYWYKSHSSAGKSYLIPSKANPPLLDRKIKRSRADMKRLRRMPGRGMR